MITLSRRGSRAKNEDDELPLEELPGELDAADEPTLRRPWWKRAVSRGPAPEGSSHGWTHGASLSARAVTVAAAVAMAAGPVALAWQVMEDPPPQQATGYDARMMARRTAATDIASRWVRAWLSTPRSQAARLDAWVPLDPAARETLPRVAPWVGAVDVRDAVATSPGVWVVTVAAQVAPARGAPERTRFFAVPVAVAGDSAVRSKALSLPSEVPDPGASVAQELSYARPIASGTGPWGTSAGFLSALLTGQGEVARYTSPGAPIRQVSPPPWDRAQLVRLAAAGPFEDRAPQDGSTVRVLATVEVSTSAPPAPVQTSAPIPTPSGDRATAAPSSPTGAVSPPAAPSRVSGPYAMQYTLTLTARAGRWEVTQMQTPQASDPETPGAQPGQ